MKKVGWPCVLVLVAGAACLPLTRRRVMSIWLPVVVAVALVAVALASTILAPSVCGSVVCVGVVVLVVIAIMIRIQQERTKERPGAPWATLAVFGPLRRSQLVRAQSLACGDLVVVVIVVSAAAAVLTAVV